jgi:hypothetical protein
VLYQPAQPLRGPKLPGRSLRRTWSTCAASSLPWRTPVGLETLRCMPGHRAAERGLPCHAALCRWVLGRLIAEECAPPRDPRISDCPQVDDTRVWHPHNTKLDTLPRLSAGTAVDRWVGPCGRQAVLFLCLRFRSTRVPTRHPCPEHPASCIESHHREQEKRHTPKNRLLQRGGGRRLRRNPRRWASHYVHANRPARGRRAGGAIQHGALPREDASAKPGPAAAPRWKLGRGRDGQLQAG